MTDAIAVMQEAQIESSNIEQRLLNAAHQLWHWGYASGLAFPERHITLTVSPFAMERMRRLTWAGAFYEHDHYNAVLCSIPVQLDPSMGHYDRS